MSAKNVAEQFKRAKRDNSWSFEGERSHNLLTHGYHRYPAKFVPQLVGKILDEYKTEVGGVVCDPFAGCGTTLVESKARGIKSVGVDVNPVAQLITQAKLRAIEPDSLNKTLASVERKVTAFIQGKPYPKTLKIISHERLSYWFSEDVLKDVSLVLRIISRVEDETHRVFLQCALSNILKDVSRWLQSSTKPQIDPNKPQKSVFERFLSHMKIMEKRNAEFYEKLKKEKNLNVPSKILLADARRTTLRKGSVSMIITSPPYVTSYEYADIHQLSGYLFDFIEDLRGFRKQFIGSAYIEGEDFSYENITPSAVKALEKLEKRDKRVAREVRVYFRDMYEVSKEMSRILKQGGKACIVIGDTTLKNVHIPNAEALAEMLESVDLRLEKIIKRSIPHKLIPTIRDKTTGRFAKKDAENSKRVYPEEYVLFLKKT